MLKGVRKEDEKYLELSKFAYLKNLEKALKGKNEKDSLKIINTYMGKKNKNFKAIGFVDNNKKSGYCGIAFKCGNELIIASRGTEPEKGSPDFITDARLGISSPNINTNRQYVDAKIFTERIINKMKKNNESINKLTFTGHSLGGAISQKEAVIFQGKIKNVQGVNFNGPGIEHQLNLEEQKKLLKYKGKIRNYIYQLDFIGNVDKVIDGAGIVIKKPLRYGLYYGGKILGVTSNIIKKNNTKSRMDSINNSIMLAATVASQPISGKSSNILKKVYMNKVKTKAIQIYKDIGGLTRPDTYFKHVGEVVEVPISSELDRNKGLMYNLHQFNKIISRGILGWHSLDRFDSIFKSEDLRIIKDKKRKSLVHSNKKKIPDRTQTLNTLVKMKSKPKSKRSSERNIKELNMLELSRFVANYMAHNVNLRLANM